jgi:Rv0078B-related antitoxin
MVPRVMAFSRTQRRLLPADGNWHLAAGWQRQASMIAGPEVATTATAALLRVFTPQWAAALPDSDREAHPFEYWYALGGGVGILLLLGWCLHLAPPPEWLVRRLRTNAVSDSDASSRFDPSAAELRAAALFVALGARVQWTEESSEKSSDLAAFVGGVRVNVEVKQLNDGDLEVRYARVDRAFADGFDRGCAEAMRDVSGIDTQARIDPPLPELERLAGLDPPDLGSARALGHAMGLRLGEFVARDSTPGEYEVEPAIRLRVSATEGAHAQHGYQSRVLTPSSGVYVTRALRIVRRAISQLATTDEPGILVLERRWPHRWPPGFHRGLEAATSTEISPSLAAIILREEADVLSRGRTAEAINVIPGPAWSRLPTELRDALPSQCTEHGVRHAVIDLLGWVSGAPWIAPPVVDESANDTATIARAASPSEKLRQGLDQMRLGFALARSGLRVRHPDATDEEIDTEFRKWLARDD